MSELLKIVSSQYKHLPKRGCELQESRILTRASILKNEPFSFQALYRSKIGCEAVSVSVETELPAEAWRVDNVAVLNAYAALETGAYESNEPGLYPDMLIPRPVKPEIISVKTAWGYDLLREKDVDALLNATSVCYQSIWFTINPDSKILKAGEYEIKVTLKNLKEPLWVQEEVVTLTVIDALLPKQTAYYTNWFHVDCLCDAFGVKPYTAAFYKIFDEHIKNMTKHRQNTLLLPAFTPPLDTAIGEERMNVQLVDIEKTENGYEFGFEKMRKFVRHSKKCGVEVFEHSHLFSQWGAKNAPNIYDKSGNRIFGFDTDAAGEEYTSFIRAYLTAFFKFAKEEKIEKSLVFHISDEPNIKHLEFYRAAHDRVADLLEGNPICDAMNDAVYYTEGLVDHPIFHTRHLDDYDPKVCPKIWLYYTGGEKDTSNRKITNTAAATRAIGLHMYKYNALGFLQWAYNYYYDQLSFGFSLPNSNVNAYKLFPGITHLCYPVNEKDKKTVVPSLREKLMGEAIDDLRALKLLESMIGREATIALCEEKIGKIDLYTIPTGEALRELRETVNEKISAQCSR